MVDLFLCLSAARSEVDVKKIGIFFNLVLKIKKGNTASDIKETKLV